jgi:hypothetical protein
LTKAGAVSSTGGLSKSKTKFKYFDRFDGLHEYQFDI